MTSVFRSRLRSSPFPRRKLRDMSLGFISRVNLSENEEREQRIDTEREDGERTCNIRIVI